MKELFEYIAKEWSVVSQTPLAFLILAAIMFGLAYLAAKWRYTAVVDQTKSANETLKEHLHLKTEQAESYKDRALKYDEKVHSIVDSNEVALKEKTLEVVNNLREFIERYKREDQDNMMERHNFSGTQSEEQRHIEWNRQTNKRMRLSSEMNAEYDRRFRVDTMILRDELRSRLPDYEPQDGHCDSSYEHPTNYFGFNDVASDLERMAKMLTSKGTGREKVAPVL